MSSFEVSIVTPAQISFESSEITDLVLPTTTGRIGILANHSPLLTGIDIGMMLISSTNEANWIPVAVSGGFGLIRDNKLTLVVREAEFASDIDFDKAESDLNEAKETLSKAADQKQTMEATLSLKRAQARFDTAKFAQEN